MIKYLQTASNSELRTLGYRCSYEYMDRGVNPINKISIFSTIYPSRKRTPEMETNIIAHHKSCYDKVRNYSNRATHFKHTTRVYTRAKERNTHLLKSLKANSIETLRGKENLLSNTIPEDLFGFLALPDEFSRLDLLRSALGFHDLPGGTSFLRSRVRSFKFANVARR